MKNIILGVISLILCYTLVLRAQEVSYNQEFLVNTYTDDSQHRPSISSLSDSSYIICWDSWSYNSSNKGIFGQILGLHGQKISAEIKISTSSDGVQYYSNVSNISDHSFVVCWERTGTSNNGIIAQICDQTGLKIGNEFKVNTYTYGYGGYPSVSCVSENNFLICWDGNVQINGNIDIYGQLFTNDGSIFNQEIKINTNIEDSQRYNKVSSLSDGRYIVCWESWNQDGRCSIFAQVLNSNGEKSGDEFKVNNSSGYNGNPSICSLLNGGFVICWVAYTYDRNGYDIYAQVFDKTSTKQGSEFCVNTVRKGSQWFPDVSGLSDGGFVVCWQSNDIYAQVFDSNRAMRGCEFLVNNTKLDSYPRYPVVNELPHGGFVISWEGNNDIYAKYYLNKLEHILNSFSLLDPFYDLTLNSTKYNFRWNQASNIRFNFPWDIEYIIYMDETDDFSSPRIIPAIYDTTCTVDSLSPGTTYFWKVLAKNIEGNSLWSSETNGFFVSHDATTIEENDLEKPESFKLLANYPNPFNPETTIKYVLPRDKAHYNVKIKIYNALGQLVIVLRDEQQKPGIYTHKWNGQNTAGQAMPSGVYFCVVQAGPFKAVQKMLLVR